MKQTNDSIFVRKLGKFKVDRTLITLSYKFVIESILSFLYYLLESEHVEGTPYESRQNN